MSIVPEDAPYRPAYVRDSTTGLFYRIGGGGSGETTPPPTPASEVQGVVNVAPATGNAVTDTANIVAAVAAARSGYSWGVNNGASGGLLLFPAGLYLINDTILLDQWAGTWQGVHGASNDPVGVSGHKGNATVIRWAGTTTDRAMVKVKDSNWATFRDIRFEGNDTYKPLYGIQAEYFSSQDGQWGNNGLTIERCAIGSWKFPSGSASWSNGMQTGIALNGDDGNNDQFVFRDLYIAGCTVRGISIPNAQSVWGIMENINIERCWGEAGLYLGSSTTIVNLTCDLNETDIKLANLARVAIFGWWSERCKTAFWDVGTSAQLSVYGGKLQIDDSANDSGSGANTMEGRATLNAANNNAYSMTFQDVVFWWNVTSKPKFWWRGTADRPTGGMYGTGHRPTLTLINNTGLNLESLNVQASSGTTDTAYINLHGEGYDLETPLTNKALSLMLLPYTVTGSASLKDGESALMIVNGAGTPNITLPAASGCRPGRTEFNIKNIGTGTCTIKSAGGLVDGVAAATGIVLARWVGKRFVTDGTDWYSMG